MESNLYFIITEDTKASDPETAVTVLHCTKEMFRMWCFMRDAGILDTARYHFTFINPEMTIVDLDT